MRVYIYHIKSYALTTGWGDPKISRIIKKNYLKYFIYLLTAIGLSSDGSSKHLHTKNT